MAHLVTLDMDELAGDPSPGLWADMQEAHCEMQALALTDRHVKTGSDPGNGWRREDYRQHAQGVFDGLVLDGQSPLESQMTMGVSRHWLLGTVFGRDVLKAYLARTRPDLLVSKWRRQPGLEGWLEDAMIALGLQDLQQPNTLHDRFQYFVRMSRTTLELDKLGRGLATG